MGAPDYSSSRFLPSHTRPEPVVSAASAAMPRGTTASGPVNASLPGPSSSSFGLSGPPLFAGGVVVVVSDVNTGTEAVMAIQVRVFN